MEVADVYGKESKDPGHVKIWVMFIEILSPITAMLCLIQSCHQASEEMAQSRSTSAQVPCYPNGRVSLLFPSRKRNRSARAIFELLTCDGVHLAPFVGSRDSQQAPLLQAGIPSDLTPLESPLRHMQRSSSVKERNQSQR
ncbi:hypothetical protein CORC01_08385 [Colletotrichum orchidophilum]|uniref:Uncharacterized protein n=1 Tax=Colletotrichum orchidophilum TaxID=1209926 RepID=A0A1G4B4R7_9PEZI|nr:uncharacterized protein CORC01_08385 [Colletotrichum orchidophilum]OHE96313.1 hypothetical protein CORC01_08385 [Colletotrichum orchidophilum]